MKGDRRCAACGHPERCHHEDEGWYCEPGGPGACGCEKFQFEGKWVFVPGEGDRE